MPEVFRMFGMRFFLTNQGLKPADLKLAEAIIEENKTIIIKKWGEFHG